MVVRAHAANPAVLRWAREAVGLSLAEAAGRLGKPTDLLQAWETGTAAPTFRQLETLAEQVYKRPVAVFFFPEPPKEEELRKEFRTLPGTEFDRFERDTRLALREAKAYQLSLTELTRGENPSSTPLLGAIRPSPTENIESLAQRTREHLNVSVEKQQSWRDTEVALKGWRSAVEEAGVFVFKRSFRQKSISGFCLHDKVVPVIMINNGTAHTRQIFTLFHEIGHLLYGVSSVTMNDVRYIRKFTGIARTIEVQCNAFAAEFLLPATQFPWHLFTTAEVNDSVERTAKLFNVSREVVLRRLRDVGMVQKETYEKKAQEWIDQSQAERGKAGTGGMYYANQATYLSETLVDLAFSQYHTGKLTKGDLAEIFDMKARNVDRFETYLHAGR